MVQEKDSMNLTSKNSVSRGLARLPLQRARMGILWVAFCIAQAGFPPAFAAPPVIAPSTSLQSKAVFLAKSASFAVTASGDAPLLYQWRFDGQDLLNQTNKTLSITAAQPTDEGDYTVRVTNSDGAVISDSVRLWVVPPSINFIKGNFTNEAGLRLPYFLADKTNLVIRTATTTSWAPGYGGNTTFNDSLAVFCSPIRATLVLQGSAAVLNWSGGTAPFQVQRATGLSVGDWTEILTNALPPLTLPVERETEFYRVVGH